LEESDDHFEKIARRVANWFAGEPIRPVYWGTMGGNVGRAVDAKAKEGASKRVGPRTVGCLFVAVAIPSRMEIKLPHLPFKFDTPEGRMEVTVRRGVAPESGGREQPFIAGLSFIESGPRALTRIPLAAKSATYGGALRVLTEGFKVNLNAHDEQSVEFRVLSALCHTKGVIDVEM
jgi:hypothetical protein